MSTQFVTTEDGVRIAYDVTGRGYPLMLLHGAGKTRRDWHQVGYVDRLKERFRVIAVDIRGSGESDFLTGIADYAIEKILEDLYAIADACDVGQFAVWGYSFGGNVARYLGAWSKRVKAMAIIGVPFGPAVDEGFDRFIDEFIQKWEPAVRAEEARTAGQKKSKSKIKGHIPVWLACFQAMRAWPSVEPGEITCPALLLAGTKNNSVMEWLESNRQTLEGSQVHCEIMDGLTHPQEFSEIDRVYSRVNAFLVSQI